MLRMIIGVMGRVVFLGVCLFDSFLPMFVQIRMELIELSCEVFMDTGEGVDIWLGSFALAIACLLDDELLASRILALGGINTHKVRINFPFCWFRFSLQTRATAALA